VALVLWPCQRRTGATRRDQHAVGLPGDDVALEAADDLWLPLLPSAVRLATYSLVVRRSRRIRARQIIYRAHCSSVPVAYIRLRWWRTIPFQRRLPRATLRRERLAKEASLLNLLGLSLRPQSVAWGGVVGTDACQRDQLPSYLPHTTRSSCASSWAISAERAIGNGEPPRTEGKLGCRHSTS
jgi:hypothetical protein